MRKKQEKGKGITERREGSQFFPLRPLRSFRLCSLTSSSPWSSNAEDEDSGEQDACQSNYGQHMDLDKAHTTKIPYKWSHGGTRARFSIGRHSDTGTAVARIFLLIASAVIRAGELDAHGQTYHAATRPRPHHVMTLNK